MFGRAPSNSLREMILWLKVILFGSLFQSLEIRMKNDFTDQEKLLFSASSLLVHFTESAENYFSSKICLVELLLDSAENQMWYDSGISDVVRALGVEHWEMVRKIDLTISTSLLKKDSWGGQKYIFTAGYTTVPASHS